MEQKDLGTPASAHRTPLTLDAAQAGMASAKIAADALKTTELRYRRLFETARDGILLLDSDVGKITGGSTAHVQASGPITVAVVAQSSHLRRRACIFSHRTTRRCLYAACPQTFIFSNRSPLGR
jgi:hypothetical protein